MGDLESAVNATTIADMLGVSTGTVYVYAKTGEIPAFKVGSRWRFYPSKVNAHLERPLDAWAQPPRALVHRNAVKQRWMS